MIHPQVASLSQALEHYRKIANKNSWSSFPVNICLRPNDSSTYIPKLRHNLILTRDLPEVDTSTLPVYDKVLFAAVIKFQERHGLKADGIVGKSTLEALNITPAQRIRQLEFNLLRWQADTIGQGVPRLLLNIPEFSLKLLDGNSNLIWQTRVIVGQRPKERQTVSLTSKISYLVLNPTWNIPNSIIRKEIIPILRKDPHYLARNQMKLYRIKGAKKYLIPVKSINWQTADPDRDALMIIQSPGKDNALGRIKFIFDNPYQIYLHDTPEKSIFNHELRDYSHGCVRVQNPEILAAYLLNQNWQKTLPWPLEFEESTVEKIVYLPKPLPIKIGYFTSWVNEKGILQFREDIYKIDKFSTDFKF
ncbi:amidase [Adhaeribacter aerolatus]|uniref:Amidase n=1 Tax=Adhaeribacter aerolatus TaxID=670289 RepID=A0A512AYB9_9BACT|nr:L,D-transpeptidase family protein [Adhaeribacter aerolatus]GEO04708.1 amidase [Adhaeribacter aerolatus]